MKWSWSPSWWVKLSPTMQMLVIVLIAAALWLLGFRPQNRAGRIVYAPEEVTTK